MSTISRAVRKSNMKLMKECNKLFSASHWSYGQRLGLGSNETDLMVNLLKENESDNFFGCQNFRLRTIRHHYSAHARYPRSQRRTQPGHQHIRKENRQSTNAGVRCHSGCVKNRRTHDRSRLSSSHLINWKKRQAYVISICFFNRPISSSSPSASQAGDKHPRRQDNNHIKNN